MVLFGDVRFFDTTLRDGEQTPGVSLEPEEKVWIAKNLDSLGVDVIEAGSAITSEGERKGIKAVVKEGLKAEICSFARCLKTDVDYALECEVDSVHLVVSVSDLHINEKLKKDRETVKQMAVDMVEYAKRHGLIVELSGEDASRADLDYLASLYKAGVDAGADRLCFCDTVGVLRPEMTYDIFSKLSSGLKAPISIHCHDDLGLATANTVAALRGGAAQAHVTINGIGERAGNTALEEVVMVLKSLYGVNTKIVTENLYPTSKLVSRLMGIPLAPNKSLVGDNAFMHESGIHTHGLMANTMTYEPITPEIIGRKRQIVLGKHAGRTSVAMALREIGLVATDKQLDEITRQIKDLGDKGKKVTDADLMSIADSVLGIKTEARIKLIDCTVLSGNRATPTASVKVMIDDEEIVESGVGLGPVDAALNALRKSVMGVADLKLDEYRVEAITGGTDAIVEVWVKMSRDTQVISARGAGPDIIMASVQAFVEGMNRLIQEKNGISKAR
ncbi:2-isopropylmalate synthase [Methanocella sp. CWC-04]|uniref:Putative (R)-citramalate synthase CimA n=1 Tax=Methanooceanicella nereidis TaxID=2052831 RepID=A0AAP2RDS1_9EURY|nr:2-isopropylmalate synthase [Methanocella sp. CWC-04]